MYRFCGVRSDAVDINLKVIEDLREEKCSLIRQLDQSQTQLNQFQQEKKLTETKIRSIPI